MRMLGQALKYLFRNFYVIALYALPASIAFALKFNHSSFLEYLFNLSREQNRTLLEVYAEFSLLPLQSLWLCLLWSVAVIVTFCLMFGYTERHMKYGVRDLWRPFKSVNFSVLTIAPAFIVIVVIEELFAFFCALFINLFSLSQGAFIIVLLPMIYGLMMCLLFLAYALIALWMPVRMLTGYTNRDAIRYSIRLSSGRLMRTMVGLMFPLLVTSPFMLILHRFSTLRALNVVFYVLCYTFIAGYIVAYTMTVYFSLTGAERKDIKPNIFKKVKHSGKKSA